MSDDMWDSIKVLGVAVCATVLLLTSIVVITVEVNRTQRVALQNGYIDSTICGWRK